MSSSLVKCVQISGGVVKCVQISGGVVKFIQQECRYGNLHPDAIWCCNTPPDAQDTADARMTSRRGASGSDA